MALSEALQVVCKCHGLSGSCSIRTCWRGLQDLKLIAKALKTKYLSATKVIPRSVGVRTQLVHRDIGIRPIRDSELVYLQSSPDFCIPRWMPKWAHWVLHSDNATRRRVAVTAVI